MIQGRLHTPFAVYGESPSYDFFIKDLKELVPGFFTKDEQGEYGLISSNHEWSIIWIGRKIHTPAILNENKEIQIPSVLTELSYFNIYLLTHSAVNKFKELTKSGALSNCSFGTKIVDTIPSTPDLIPA